MRAAFAYLFIFIYFAFFRCSFFFEKFTRRLNGTNFFSFILGERRYFLLRGKKLNFSCRGNEAILAQEKFLISFANLVSENCLQREGLMKKKLSDRTLSYITSKKDQKKMKSFFFLFEIFDVLH